jgi:hypothetical protein
MPVTDRNLSNQPWSNGYGVLMNGRFRSFFLNLGPVQRALRQEIRGEAEQAWQAAEEALDRARERQRKALQERADLNTELQRHNDELGQRITELEATAHDLRKELVAERHSGHRRQREHDAEEERRRELDQETTSDLFCCLTCTSLWLLSTRTDNTCTVRRPAGDGCATCNKTPLHWSWAARTSGAKSAAATKVARPSRDTPGPMMILPLPGDRRARTGIGVRLAAELLGNDQDSAIPTLAGERVRDRAVPPCPALHAIATGLDRVPETVKTGFVWCATDIPGAPDHPAETLTEIATRATSPSLRDVARGIRIIGLVSCAADNRLGDCHCARQLVTEDKLKRMVDDLLDLRPPEYHWFDPTDETAKDSPP